MEKIHKGGEVDMNRVMREYARLRSSKYRISGIASRHQRSVMEYAYNALEYPMFILVEVNVTVDVRDMSFCGQNSWHSFVPDIRRWI